MTDNRTTELLTKLLNERGVEWKDGDAAYEIEWRTPDGRRCSAMYWKPTFSVLISGCTPEQAIAATLGSDASAVRRAEWLRGIADEMRSIGASSMTPHELLAFYAHEVDRVADSLMFAVTLGSEINGDTSDGYHTFNELYHHRAVLFSVIVRDHRELAWKSRKHHDGTMYEGMFIVGIETPNGQATYHYDFDPYWEMFDCEEREYAPEWDGHTSDEAIERIGKLATTLESGTLTAEQVRKAVKEAEDELLESCEYVGDMGQRKGDVLKAFGKLKRAIADELNAELGSGTKLCYAADENYKRCKYSVNRGWCDDAPFLVWDDTGHLFITMGGLKTWDVTDDAKKWFAELGSGTCEVEVRESAWGGYTRHCGNCGADLGCDTRNKQRFCPRCGKRIRKAVMGDD